MTRLPRTLLFYAALTLLCSANWSPCAATRQLRGGPPAPYSPRWPVMPPPVPSPPPWPTLPPGCISYERSRFLFKQWLELSQPGAHMVDKEYIIRRAKDFIEIIQSCGHVDGAFFDITYEKTATFTHAPTHDYFVHKTPDPAGSGAGPAPTPAPGPTAAPTTAPTAAPTSSPTAAPTAAPTSSPTASPTGYPDDYHPPHFRPTNATPYQRCAADVAASADDPASPQGGGAGAGAEAEEEEEEEEELRMEPQVTCPRLPEELEALRQSARQAAGEGSEGLPRWERDLWPGCTVPLPDALVQSAVVHEGASQLRGVLGKLLRGEEVYVWNPGLSFTYGLGSSDTLYQGARYLEGSALNCSAAMFADGRYEFGTAGSEFAVRPTTCTRNSYSCLFLQWLLLAFPCQVHYAVGYGAAGPTGGALECLDVEAWTGLPRVDLLLHEGGANGHLSLAAAEVFYRRLLEAFPGMAVVELYALQYAGAVPEEARRFDPVHQPAKVAPASHRDPAFREGLEAACPNDKCFRGLWRLAMHYDFTALSIGRGLLAPLSPLRRDTLLGRLHFHPWDCNQGAWRKAGYAEPPEDALRAMYERGSPEAWELHMGDYGYSITASLLISFLRAQLRIAAAALPPPAGGAAAAAALALPPPLYPGEVVHSGEARLVPVCLGPQELVTRAVESEGWSQEGDEEAGPGVRPARPLPLYAAAAGAGASWRVDGHSRVWLVSYAGGEGRARAWCSGGCTCAEAVLVAAGPAQPLTAGLPLHQPAPGAACLVHLRTLDHARFEVRSMTFIDGRNDARLRELRAAGRLYDA